MFVDGYELRQALKSTGHVFGLNNPAGLLTPKSGPTTALSIAQ